MNERIEELWDKVNIQEEGTHRSIVITTESELQEFAELIVRECADVALQEEHEPSDCILGHFGLKR